MSKFQSVLDAARGETQGPVRGMSPVPRQKGKRSDPSFQQITAYIKKETHRRVKIALLEKEQGKEFSELVEELLTGWLEAN